MNTENGNMESTELTKSQPLSDMEGRGGGLVPAEPFANTSQSPVTRLHGLPDSIVDQAAAPHWNRYRCDGHFKAMLAWLRSKGVTARNPLHTMRKEFGCLINQKFGIFAASAALRHSNISTTREAYVDSKERIALDIGELMAGKEQASRKQKPHTTKSA